MRSASRPSRAAPPSACSSTAIPTRAALVRANIEAFGLTGVTRIFRRDATDLGPAGTVAPFNLAFLDPPYDQGLAERALAALAAGNWLVAGAIVVVRGARERRGRAAAGVRGDSTGAPTATRRSSSRATPPSVMIEKFAYMGGWASSEFLDLNHTSNPMILVSLMIPKFAP